MVGRATDGKKWVASRVAIAAGATSLVLMALQGNESSVPLIIPGRSSRGHHQPDQI